MSEIGSSDWRLHPIHSLRDGLCRRWWRGKSHCVFGHDTVAFRLGVQVGEICLSESTKWPTRERLSGSDESDYRTPESSNHGLHDYRTYNSRDEAVNRVDNESLPYPRAHVHLVFLALGISDLRRMLSHGMTVETSQ